MDDNTDVAQRDSVAHAPSRCSPVRPAAFSMEFPGAHKSSMQSFRRVTSLSAKGNVVPDGYRKQEDILQDHAISRSSTENVELADVDTVDLDGTRGCLVEADSKD